MAADEVDADAYRDAGYARDDHGFPLVGKVAQLDGGAHVDEQHGDQHAGDEQQGGVVKHRVRQHLGPETGQEEHRGEKEHGDDSPGLRGDHVAKTEDEQDDEYCEDGQHWSLHR